LSTLGLVRLEIYTKHNYANTVLYEALIMNW
jgi:hypothetical protein